MTVERYRHYPDLVGISGWAELRPM